MSLKVDVVEYAVETLGEYECFEMNVDENDQRSGEAFELIMEQHQCMFAMRNCNLTYVVAVVCS